MQPTARTLAVEAEEAHCGDADGPAGAGQRRNGHLHCCVCVCVVWVCGCLTCVRLGALRPSHLGALAPAGAAVLVGEDAGPAVTHSALHVIDQGTPFNRLHHNHRRVTHHAGQGIAPPQQARRFPRR